MIVWAHNPRESELTTLRERSGLSGIHHVLASHCTMAALPYAGCGDYVETLDRVTPLAYLPTSSN